MGFERQLAGAGSGLAGVSWRWLESSKKCEIRIDGEGNRKNTKIFSHGCEADPDVALVEVELVGDFEYYDSTSSHKKPFTNLKRAKLVHLHGNNLALEIPYGEDGFSAMIPLEKDYD